MPAAGRPTRAALSGVRMILRYNWPLYVAGAATAVTGAAVAKIAWRQPQLRAAASTAAIGAGWLALASLTASWWVYDRSELYRWTWLSRSVPSQPGAIIVIHAGLDEASGPVSRMWPQAVVESVDVHLGAGPTTASLRRARTADGVAPDPDRWETAPADAVIVFLAAHEMRTPGARAALFATIRDALRPGGRLVLIEHARDIANALVYGPAIGHFYPVRTWRRAVDEAGLRLLAEERVTPFVVLLTAERHDATGASG